MFTVTWTIELDDESTFDARDAAEQAWQIIADSVNGNGLATYLEVSDDDWGRLGTFDMASGSAEPT